MERGAWRKPVVMEIYGRPGIVTIPDTMEAALMLLSGWSGKRTDVHTVAVMACRDVLTGRAIPSLARANFIEAALEAGYRILPETFLDDRWYRDQDLNIPGLSPTTTEVPAGLLARWKSRAASPAEIPPSRSTDQRAGMRELLQQLGQVLGQILRLILVEVIRGSASFLNIRVRNTNPR